MDQILVELHKISVELTEIKRRLEIHEAEKSFEDWIPRKKLMGFLDYGDTQMSALLNSGKLRVAEIGNRKFIKKQSVLTFLENSLKQSK